MRQVPDNQEVYVDKAGLTSITFDILERVSHTNSDQDALLYHLSDVFDDDEDEPSSNDSERQRAKTWETNSAVFSKLPYVSLPLQSSQAVFRCGEEASWTDVKQVTNTGIHPPRHREA